MVKFFESKCPQCDEKEIVTHMKTDTVFVAPPQKPKIQYTENNEIETLVAENIDDENVEEETSIYESEFSLEGIEQDDVFADQLLQTRTVKVKLYPKEKQDIKLPDNFFLFFEIQQWSTPIKNKITYYRNQNMIKIKGIAIDYASLFFWNNAYYLEINNRYYAVPETDHYEKLNLVNLPQ